MQIFIFIAKILIFHGNFHLGAQWMWPTVSLRPVDEPLLAAVHSLALMVNILITAVVSCGSPKRMRGK